MSRISLFKIVSLLFETGHHEINCKWQRFKLVFFLVWFFSSTFFVYRFSFSQKCVIMMDKCWHICVVMNTTTFSNENREFRILNLSCDIVVAKVSATTARNFWSWITCLHINPLFVYGCNVQILNQNVFFLLDVSMKKVDSLTIWATHKSLFNWNSSPCVESISG